MLEFFGLHSHSHKSDAVMSGREVTSINALTAEMAHRSTEALAFSFCDRSHIELAERRTNFRSIVLLIEWKVINFLLR